MAAVILVEILATTMSTVDRQLLAVASSVSESIVSNFLEIRISEKKALIVARMTVVMISLLTIFLKKIRTVRLYLAL